MRTTLLVTLLLTACGGLSQRQYDYCAAYVDVVHTMFVIELHGTDTATLPADETEVGQRMAEYFDSGGVVPEGMTEGEQEMVDRACEKTFIADDR